MTHEEIARDIIIAIISTAVPLLTAMGLLIRYTLSYRHRLKELEIKKMQVDLTHEETEKGIDINKLGAGISAARELATILQTVVEPLSIRVKALEEDAIAKQKQINTLNETIISLKFELGTKQLEIEKLTKENKDLAIITNEQERKIIVLEEKNKAQEHRIYDLECKLKGKENA